MTKKAETSGVLGIQLLIEFYDCDRQVLNNQERIERIMLQAAEAAKVTVVNQRFHRFSPQGISGVVVIAESHFTIHTWPEHGYCAVDIFTCGEPANTDEALTVLKNEFSSGSERVFRVDRGLHNRERATLHVTSRPI